MEDILIRKYRKEDRQSIRDIAWETAFIGESADTFFSDKEIFADFLTMYFTDYEPESCFVAESGGKVIGYLIGAINENVLRQVNKFKIMPRLILKVIKRGVLLRKKNMIYFSRCLASFLKGEFRDRDFSMEYPAILHINIIKDFRGSKIGSRLVAAFLEYLAVKKIKGAHLATMSSKAGGFFKKNGFNMVYSAPRSYFKYLANEDMAVYVYGKGITY